MNHRVLRLGRICLHALVQVPVGANAGVPLSEQCRQGNAFPCTYDSLLEALGSYQRLFAEPDGSFVWVSEQAACAGAAGALTAAAWQTDGLVSERGGRVISVELQGTLGQAEFSSLIAALCMSENQVGVQLVEQGTFVPLTAFLDAAAA